MMKKEMIGAGKGEKGWMQPRNEEGVREEEFMEASEAQELKWCQIDWWQERENGK